MYRKSSGNKNMYVEYELKIASVSEINFDARIYKLCIERSLCRDNCRCGGHFFSFGFNSWQNQLPKMNRKLKLTAKLATCIYGFLLMFAYFRRSFSHDTLFFWVSETWFGSIETPNRNTAIAHIAHDLNDIRKWETVKKKVGWIKVILEEEKKNISCISYYHHNLRRLSDWAFFRQVNPNSVKRNREKLTS